MKDILKKEIKLVIETSITNFFKNKTVKTVHVLDKLFPAERKIRSLIGGLETSFGTTVWEPIAKAIAKSNNFEVLDKKGLLRPKPMPVEIDFEISQSAQGRLNNPPLYTMEECKEKIRKAAEKINSAELNFVAPPAGKGVDIYLIKNNKEYAIDLKTNQINRAGGQNFDRQLLEWYAYRFCLNPAVDFQCYIAMPFNPFDKNWWDKNSKKVLPLTRNELLVEDDFWEFISGRKGIWKEIESIFDELKNEGFGKKFEAHFS